MKIEGVTGLREGRHLYFAGCPVMTQVDLAGYGGAF